MALALFALAMVPNTLSAVDPQVSNVKANQKFDLNPLARTVEIKYDLADPDSATVTVALEVSSDGGQTWTVSAPSLTGTGILPAVKPGNGLVIIWNAPADWPGNFSKAMRFRVTASDTPPAPTGMALIPAGSFEMGNALSASGDGYSDELPVHPVSVSAFYMDKYEVTKELWDEVRAWGLNNGYTDLDVGNGGYASKGVNHPVHTITWYAMVKWCNARSKKAGLTECYTVSGSVYKTGQSSPVLNMSANGYRLPTEAEWEKAARGDMSGKRFPWGDTINHSQANYNSNSAYSYDVSPTRGYHPTYNNGVYPYTSPVGSFAANGYGLYDMAGNVWEWCWDWYGSYGSGTVSDPTGPASGSDRVGRGGGWGDSAYYCRVAGRSYGDPGYYGYGSYLGFRCARSSVP